ncbi:DNA cytosine methyltransferase [Burkholderia multivorans]|uniref:DNA cytosine methyltransferase n=1 Tax=Burkholderia multivorans TaxID=87883 RepID=UPI001C61572A|nr:DNA cytosine methyltransferase [Burkholderia multivorans]UQN69384.1 DNA cytosine methyltransferase [Burkholderia multivorans]UQN75112.1 DNA cytosine methyltransferase [Burkholderia multivorans]
MKRNIIAADIFSGGGGLTVGLKAAGIKVAAAVEFNAHAVATYRQNHREVITFQSDVREISGDELCNASATGQIDILAGCPPCQGFSSLTTKYKRNDPRNDLILEFVRLAEEIRPTCIMMENVPGLVTKGKQYLEEACARLESAGYIISKKVLQVADYGVPQSRRRFVLLAGLGFEIPIPEPTHSRNGQAGKQKWRTVADVIKGLPKPMILQDTLNRGGPSAFNWHVVRNISEENRKRLASTRPGASRASLPTDLRPACHANDNKGFTNVYGRMSWCEPSPTITAGCTTLSKGRFGHPSQLRTISLREAALLQTFPDSYQFATNHMEHACSIVGNALPCDFARALALQCVKYVKQPH